MTLRALVLVVALGAPRLFVGSQVDAERAVELAGAIPEPCLAEAYWMVARVDRAP